MANRERRTERAAWLIRRDLIDLGNDLRSARLASGLTLQVVADRVGTSASTVLRIERARFPPGPTPDLVARYAAVVGMRVRIKVYPEGPPLRDAASVALERRFLELVGPAAPRLRLEQHVTLDPNDRRAFDATMDIPGGLGLEFVVKGTHSNRRAVGVAADVIATTFPLGTRRVLNALREGRDPGANGLIFI